MTDQQLRRNCGNGYAGVMVDQVEMARSARRLDRSLRRRLGLKGASFTRRAQVAVRIVPRKVARDIATVAEGAHLAGHPRIARTLDGRALAKAETRARRWLEGNGPRDLRRGRLLGWLGALSVNLFLVTGLVVGVLIWRGYL